MHRDWEALAFTSHYHTAVAIHEAFQAGDVEDAMSGLEELIDALSRSEERALQSYLVRLMQHIIKWKLQPERRSPSWSATIRKPVTRCVSSSKSIPGLRMTESVRCGQWSGRAPSMKLRGL